MRIRIALLLLTFLLAGCSGSPEATMPPTYTPLAVQITLLPTPAPVTPQPSPSPSPTIAPAECTTQVEPVITGQSNGSDVRYTLPDPAAIAWQVQDARGSGRVWRMRGMDALMSAITIAPSHTWATVELLTRYAADSTTTTLYGLDLEGGLTWRMRAEQDQTANVSAWLPDGRVLWVKDGDLWLANANGQGERALKAPGKVERVWVSPAGTVLVSGEATWRLLMPEERWERVAGIGQIMDFNFSNDGSYGVALAAAATPVEVGRFYIPATEGAVFSGEYWQIPLEAGGQAELIPNSGVAGFTPGGSGFAPRPLGGGALWSTGIVLANADGTDGVPMLLDMQSRTLLALDQVLPGASRGTQLEASPSGRWVLIDRKWVAPAEDLSQGLPLPNRENERVIGWSTESPDAVWLVHAQQGVTRLVRIAPPDLIEETLFEVNDGDYTTSVPGYILFLKTSQAALGPQRTLLAYRAGNGALAGQLTLNDASMDGPRVIALDGRTLLLHTTLYSGGGEQPCVYSDAWLRWQVLP